MEAVYVGDAVTVVVDVEDGGGGEVVIMKTVPVPTREVIALESTPPNEASPTALRMSAWRVAGA